MKKSRGDRYVISTGISLAGGVFILTPLFLKIPADYQTFAAKESLRQSEEINRDRIKQRKITSEISRRAGLIPEGKTLRLLDYDDSDKKPRLKRQTLQNYLADAEIFVYDRSGKCIGKIQNREFIWVREARSVCDNAPTINFED